MKTGKSIFRWSDIKIAELDLTQLIRHYDQSNKAEEKSPKIVSWYSEMLTCFAILLKSRDSSVNLGNFNVTSVLMLF